MKKLVALCAALAVLVGCAPQGFSPLPAPPLEETTTLRLALSRESGETGRQLAGLLAREIAKSSRGRLELTIVEQPPAASLETGQADLALLTDREMALSVPEMAFLEHPFVWSSPLHFTVGANAPANMELADVPLRSRLGASQLAAFYNGSPGMVANRPLDGGDDLTDLVAVVFPDSRLVQPMEEAGLETDAMEPARCLAALTGEEADLSEADVGLLTGLAKEPGDWYWLPTYHRIQGVWLLLSDQATGGLSGEGGIALREGVAAVLQKGDSARLDQEEQVLAKAMGERIIPLEEDLSALRESVRDWTKKQLAGTPGGELLENYLALSD